MSLRSRIRGGHDYLTVKVATAAQFLTLRLNLIGSTQVGCDDSDGPCHAPRYLDVSPHFMLKSNTYIICTRANPIVLIIGLVMAFVGVMVMGAAALMISDGDILFAIIPIAFALFTAWLSTTFMISWKNSYSNEVQVDFDERDIVVSNRPIGPRTQVRYEDIKMVCLTDIIKPRWCNEILLVTKNNKTHQLCSFGIITDDMRRLQVDIESSIGLKQLPIDR